MKKRNFYRFLFYVWWTIMLILTSYPKLHSPAIDSFNFDKLAHSFVYFVYGWLFMKMHEKELSGKILNRLLLLALIVPLFDEIHQIPIPGRSFSPWDLLADLFGFAIVFFLFRIKLGSIQTPAE